MKCMTRDQINIMANEMKILSEVQSLNILRIREFYMDHLKFSIIVDGKE